MNDRLPPLSTLRVFEAVARHLSIKNAAVELSVTSGAISLQIKNLEDAIGLPLFLRKARRMELTDAGQRYFLSVSAAFRVLKDATAMLQKSRTSILTISCTQGFALQWLLPRLNKFTSQMPEVDVRVSTSHALVDFNAEDIDFAIRHGLGRYSGLQSHPLLDDGLVPVASPALLARMPQLQKPGDLQHFTLLHDEEREDWRVWLAAAGALKIDGTKGLLFTGNAVIDAVLAGKGIALLRESFIKDELAQGLLKKLFTKKLNVDIAYHLVYPHKSLQKKGAEEFRAWLLEESKLN